MMSRLLPSTVSTRYFRSLDILLDAHAFSFRVCIYLIQSQPHNANANANANWQRQQTSKQFTIASNLVYTFTEMLDKARDGTLALKIPDDFQEQDLSRFLTTSMNLTEYNDGNGIRFSEIYSILEYNSEELLTVFEDSMSRQVVANLRTSIAPFADNGKNVYLTFHRSIQQKVACVYSVVKDTISQRVMVSFRGSTTKVDWQTNLDARVVGMRTPTKIVPYITNKKYKTEVLVHRGFYDYLFDNDKIDGLQRYDQVCLDIQETLRGDAGYGVYITGHSLGAALATMFACKLAGAGSSYNDIPRPITCVSWAAPFSGTEGYRIVIEVRAHSPFLFRDFRSL